MTKALKFISFALLIGMTSANAIPEKYQDIAEKLITASLADSTVYNRLAYVCDTFGPRLSGSDNLENAIDWILEELEQDGFSNVRGEKVEVPAWIRGKESARLIKPFAKDLDNEHIETQPEDVFKRLAAFMATVEGSKSKQKTYIMQSTLPTTIYVQNLSFFVTEI